MKSNSAESFRRRHVVAGCPVLRERDERLDSLKLLVGKLAHDFNNFLAPILGYVALIKEEVGEGVMASKYATTLEQSAHRAEDEIASMLIATQPQRRFQPCVVDLGSLVDRELEAWRLGLGPGAGILVERHLETCETELDPNQWQALVQHLLRNARLALAMGGRLSVRLARVSLTLERVVELGLPSSEGWLLEFSDTGLGMGRDVARRAFEPFFTTRPKNQSIGMGLTLVHSVVRWHGGQVILESREEEGTSVRIWIPNCAGVISAPPPVMEAEVSRVQIGRPTGSKVLLVDDDPLVLEVLKSCLQKHRYDVQTAADGMQGFRMFERRPQDWLLVVSDVTMPNMDGIELARRIRELRPETRILLVTGDADAARECALEVLNPNPPLLLRKPFTLKALMETVRGVLA